MTVLQVMVSMIKETQLRVNNANWNRSIKGLDGNYYSWKGVLPPGVENWLAEGNCS